MWGRYDDYGHHGHHDHGYHHHEDIYYHNPSPVYATGGYQPTLYNSNAQRVPQLVLVPRSEYSTSGPATAYARIDDDAQPPCCNIL